MYVYLSSYCIATYLSRIYAHVYLGNCRFKFNVERSTCTWPWRNVHRLTITMLLRIHTRLFACMINKYSFKLECRWNEHVNSHCLIIVIYDIVWNLTHCLTSYSENLSLNRRKLEKESTVIVRNLLFMQCWSSYYHQCEKLHFCSHLNISFR